MNEYEEAQQLEAIHQARWERAHIPVILLVLAGIPTFFGWYSVCAYLVFVAFLAACIVQWRFRIDLAALARRKLIR